MVERREQGGREKDERERVSEKKEDKKKRLRFSLHHQHQHRRSFFKQKNTLVLRLIRNAYATNGSSTPRRAATHGTQLRWKKETNTSSQSKTHLTCAKRNRNGINFGGTSPTAPRPWRRAAWPEDAEDDDESGGAALLLEAPERGGASARAETTTRGMRRRRLDGVVIRRRRGALVAPLAAFWRRPAASDTSAGAELA